MHDPATIAIMDMMKTGIAEECADRWHRGQTRKYTGAPYIVHPKAVAARLKQIAPDDHRLHAAAYLHDVLEDCNVSFLELGKKVGVETAELVQEVTDQSDPNQTRAQRKASECKRLAKVSKRAKTLKLADILDNLPSIRANDPKFAQVYEAESLSLLAVLVGGDSVLWDELFEMLKEPQK